MQKKWGLWVAIALLVGCGEEQTSQSSAEEIEPAGNEVIYVAPPAGFDSIPVPADNQLTQPRIELGRKLFFETAMSLDSTVSCATCHIPQEAFTDGLAKSMGIRDQIVDRNSPSLINIAYHPLLLRDATLNSLEKQVLVPIDEEREFDFNIVELSERLGQDAWYGAMAHQAYGRDIDPFVITRALAAFQRTLVSADSPFDKEMYQGYKDVLSDTVLAGYKLFKSERLNCVQCHAEPYFTTFELANNGLYKTYLDSGKARITLRKRDNGFFKIPSLRNLSYTAPYMHDGSLKTLEEVIDHYGGGGAGHYNQSPLVSGFEITELERIQLISFLRSLDDPSVLEKFE